MLRFTILFSVIAITLFILELTAPGQQFFVQPFTALIADFCTWLVQLFDGDAVAEGNVIRSMATGEGIQIVAGCNGVEAMIILFAALVAFPAPWLYRLKGMFWGFIAIQALNSVRIISLFYLLQWDKDWFDWFHLYLWQALIILDALVVWLIWLKHLPSKSHTDDNSDRPVENLEAMA